MMFAKNFFIKFVCNHIFSVLFLIEIKETSVVMFFVFLKEERWFALAKNGSKCISVANVFS
jgi:hypothetical protein